MCGSEIDNGTICGRDGRCRRLPRCCLTGGFDFELRFSEQDTATRTDAAAGDLPSIFTALQEQLGLKLEPGRGPVDIVVIDHVERPTEN